MTLVASTLVIAQTGTRQCAANGRDAPPRTLRRTGQPRTPGLEGWRSRARTESIGVATSCSRNQTDLRGFEWRYLWQLCQDESRRTLGTFTEGDVPWSDIQSDQLFGRWEQAGDRRWKDRSRYGNSPVVANSRRSLLTRNRVSALAFSPTNPGLLAIGDGDRTIKLWDLTSDAPPSILAKDTSAIYLAFSPDGEQTRLGQSDSGPEHGWVKVWDVETRKQDLVDA